MIEDILQPLVGERFKNDARYREGHLRVINALPQRRVLGLHAPEMKQIAQCLTQKGYEIVLPDGKCQRCANGIEVIHAFEATMHENLCYEETVIWGYLINHTKGSLPERLAMLSHYIPVLDNWAVCDSYCAHAKWIARADRNTLWAFLQPWFNSKREFEVRFAVVVSMCYFLSEEWIERVFSQIDNINFDRIKSDYKTTKGKPTTPQQGTVPGTAPYYVRMGVAWLLATALVKFPNETRTFVRSSHLPVDVIRLYIRKARESFRTRTVSPI